MPNCRTEDLLCLLLHLNKHIATRFERCAGISPNRLELLFKLAGGQISQAELQKAVSIDPAAVTRHVQQLEAEGLVTRTRCESDNRLTLVQLTEEGHSRLRSHQEQKDRFMEELQSGLREEERLELVRMLQQLGDKVQQVETALSRSGNAGTS
ncbi:MarR family transcriptional regulator [Paenibacillus sp. D9]|nr:MarR family transcriptional regulator [Paenibacillus sp. D9]